MLCSVYKSIRKDGAYLYVMKKGDFSQVPEQLMTMFGPPSLMMTFNLEGRKLAHVDVNKVKASLESDGFFLQLPPPPENVLETYKAMKAAQMQSHTE
ncbi:YcgL domain-containing protein [Vibrio quintilis]|uniref:YcgL domain-containing protein VQ7734_04091 n=1 Tax=Vibrio quintilis TaxID=1117707 RepID=A0A1M7Z055_9VIBR|nr:YcgL domain-containing protein [Vibrio quintilis]SHO58319.1 Protein YcgL [Vibrio quintilis]